MSYLKTLSHYPKAEIEALLQTMSIEALTLLAQDFTFYAHDYQMPPKPDYTIWLLMGGRGSGKTRAGAEAVIRAARYEGCRSIALIGENILDVKNVMVHGESGIINCCPDDFKPVIRGDSHIEFPNGAKAFFFSSNSPNSLRGPQFDFAWCDELAKWKNDYETFDMLQFALRMGDNPRQIITTTPKGTKLLSELLDMEDVSLTKARTYDNRDNLPEKFFDKIIKRYENTLMGRQELDGEFIKGLEGALWDQENIEKTRIPLTQKPEHIERIVVAVDPPISQGENADECGIIVAGANNVIKDGVFTKEGYILADYSVKGLSPNGWAKQVIRAYRDYNADRIIMEINQGGNILEALIRTIDPMVSYEGVRATRGKITRAEPVAALYEQGLVHHVGIFKVLEDQMCHFTQERIHTHDHRSPDRADALVWAISSLFFGSRITIPRIRTLN